MRKILVFAIIVSLAGAQPSLTFAQFPDIEQITSKLQGMQTNRETPIEEPQEGGYKKFVCPSCGREFELNVDPNDLELKKGIKKIICPYDGTEFYPRNFMEKQEELQYVEVRCPDCRKEFKAHIDVNAILAGNPQTLTCPYDTTKFYFKAESFQPAGLTRANFQTVICPTDRRKFKVYIDPEKPTEIVCPHDGTKFFPTPDLIVPKMGMIRGTDGASQFFAPSTPTDGMSELTMPEEKISNIEAIFSKYIPLHVPKDMKQFGYEIFKPKVETTRQKDKKVQKESTLDSREDNLLRTLIDTEQQEKGLLSKSEMDGAYHDFLSPIDIPAIEDYVLGPGDSLKISIWGKIQENFSLPIDAEGKIFLPKSGPMYIWGLKFTDAEQRIKESLLKSYINVDVSVSMERLRGIKVFILGEVTKPGAYTVSALSNVFQVLYAAGGPTKLGSMRKIKLIRENTPDKEIDLYNILLKGDRTQNYKLHAGDTVFIPPIGDVVGIAGNVKRPAIYEFREKVSLSDVITEMAGGISSIGYVQRIQLERIQDHLRKVVLDLEFKSLPDLQSSQNNLEIQDGDLVIIFPITPIRYNFVSITGNILRPGDYELKQGMRLKDLTDKSGGILPGTYLNRAEISRFRSDQTREIMPVCLTDLIDGKEEANIALKEWDVVTIYSNREILPNLFVEIDGAVNNPGKYELTENMKISDLIFRAGGMKHNALMSNGELFRTFSGSQPKIFDVNFSKVLSKDITESNSNDLMLEVEDHLFVRGDISKGEKFLITLSGEFRYPGKYAVEKGTRLSAIIKRAGGFTGDAFLDGSIYTRASTRVVQEKMIKNFLDSEQRALLQEQSSLAVGLTPVQAESRNKLIEYRQRLMERLANAEIKGRILIRVDEDMLKFVGSEYDIVIENGDVLHIPTRPSTVQVIGNVYGPTTVTFSKKKGVDYYINKVGGLTKYADANRIFIIRANGETISHFVRAIKVKRGDVIIVPEEFKYRTLPGLVFKDIIQVLYQATLGAAVTITAVNTL